MSKDAWKRFSDEGYKHYFVVDTGFKYNMMDLQAAIGIHQLRRVEANWKRRQEIWKRYNSALRGFPVMLPSDPEPDTRHGYHLYTLLLEPHASISRDAFLHNMTTRNIGVGVHYLSIPEHPIYQEKFGWNLGQFPNATSVGRKTVSLPLSAKLTDDEVERVIDAVTSIFAGAKAVASR
jgi:dTDP-4-amino-4,6-dideoxygalactose transaminase